MVEEIWKDIPGYEGLYQISSQGRVKRLPLGKQWPSRRTHNNIRKPKMKGGYLSINLSKDNEVKCFLVHRLVAMVFIPNLNNLPCVNHKDEDKTNNSSENLEWCSYRYNANYGTGKERQKLARADNPNDAIVRKKVGELNSKAVRQLSPQGEVIATFKSLSEASESTGVHISTIIRQCKRKSGYARKFKFEYV